MFHKIFQMNKRYKLRNVNFNIKLRKFFLTRHTRAFLEKLIYIYIYSVIIKVPLNPLNSVEWPPVLRLILWR